MRLITSAFVSLAFFVGSLHAQQIHHQHHPARINIYHGYYNGYGYRPGLTLYPNYFSVDYNVGHSWYHYGYIPVQGGFYNYNSYNIPPFNKNRW